MGKIGAAKQQALIDAFTGPALPNDHMTVYKRVFDNFDFDPNATKHVGFDGEVFFRWLELECPDACRAMRNMGKGHLTTAAAFKAQIQTFDIIGKHLYQVTTFVHKNANTKLSYMEVDAGGDRVRKDNYYFLLPLLPKPNPPSLALPPLITVAPTPLPPGVTVKYWMCGFLESDTSRSQAVIQAQIGSWTDAKRASECLLKASIGIQNILWQGQVVLPRDEGIALESGSTYADWLNAVNLKTFLHHVDPNVHRLVRPFTRIDDWLENTLFAQAIPPHEYLVAHFSAPSLILQSPKTLAAIAYEYTIRTNGDGRNAEWSMGVSACDGHPVARILNSTARDQKYCWYFHEAAIMWRFEKDSNWPIPEHRLRQLGLSANRAHIVHNLTRLIGTRNTDLNMTKMVSQACFPGLNVI